MLAKRFASSPRISVVVTSRNEGANLRRTVENLDDTLDGDSNVVVVDDGSTDGSADGLARRRGRVRVIRNKPGGLTRARNLGAREARGEILVFADAHLELPSGWWRPLVELLEQPKVGAVAPAIANLSTGRMLGCGLTFRSPQLGVRWLKSNYKGPRAAPILPGCCLAMRREVFIETGGWDEGLLHRGNVDKELSIRLWLLGYQLLVTPKTVVGHLFRGRSPYPVGWPQYLHNRLRLAFVHLNAERVAKVVVALRTLPCFGEALLLFAEGDAAARRRQLLSRRVRDDDWFFARFGIQW